jgi:hypothetical protein
MELEDLKRDAKNILGEALLCIGHDNCMLCPSRMMVDCSDPIKRKVRALNEALQEYQRPAVKVRAVKRSKAVRDAMEKL